MNAYLTNLYSINMNKKFMCNLFINRQKILIVGVSINMFMFFSFKTATSKYTNIITEYKQSC